MATFDKRYCDDMTKLAESLPASALMKLILLPGHTREFYTALLRGLGGEKLYDAFHTIPLTAKYYQDLARAWPNA